MFKKIFICLALIVTSSSFAQTINVDKNIEKERQLVEEKTELKSVRIEVSVDSLEELESTFTVKDIKDILDNSTSNEDISFKITCKGKHMGDGLNSETSYKVSGNTSDKDNFLHLLEKVRTAAIKYYKS